MRRFPFLAVLVVSGILLCGCTTTEPMVQEAPTTSWIQDAPISELSAPQNWLEVMAYWGGELLLAPFRVAATLLGT